LARQTGFLIFILLIALPACSPAQASVPGTTAAAAATDYNTYVVQPGDTLSQIAARFHSTIEQLIALNVERYPALARDYSVLQVGWQLRVPNSVVSTATVTVAGGLPRSDLNQAARQIVDEINTARVQQGLVLLRGDVALTRIASERSADLIARDYFSHYDPQTGQEPLLRNLQATNFSYRYAGENIAEIKNDAGWVPPLLTVAARYGATDLASEFVKGWLNSPEHRANILNARYRRTGVVLAASGDGRRIVATQVFAD
jgi:uncharacterized protein YkwD